MQASQIFEIVIVTLIFSDVVPQLNYASHTLSGMGTSLLPYFILHTLFSFQGASLRLPLSLPSFAVSLFPASFEARSQSLTAKALRSNSKSLFGGPEWARTTDLAIISRTL